MGDRDREATTSITHLVKIVAKEVCVKEIKEHERDLHDRAGIDNVVRKVRRRGEKWTDHEDQDLSREVGAALEAIAENHERSIVAVATRIRRKDLIR